MGQSFTINPRVPLNRLPAVPAQAWRNPVLPIAVRRLAGVAMRVRPLSGVRFGLGDTLPVIPGITWKLVNGAYVPYDANGNNASGVYGHIDAATVTGPLPPTPAPAPAPAPAPSSVSLPPSGGTTAAPPASNPLVAAGQVYHYNDGTSTYAIYIVSVGTGGPGGLQTVEGVQLSLGTVYRITSGAGAGEIWQTTGPNSATRRADLETNAAPPAGDSSATSSTPPAAGAPPASAASLPSWFQQTAIGSIPNWALVGGGLVALLAFHGKR